MRRPATVEHRKYPNMKKSTFTILLLSLFLMQGIAQQVAQEQRLLITKRTASWCPNCGTWGWTLFKNLTEDNEDKAVLIAAHYDGVLASSAGEELTDNFGGFYQPRFFVNETDQNASQGNIGSIRASVKDQVDAAFALTPVANTGFAPVYSDGALKVDAKVKFFQQAQGDYYLGIYLIENHVTAYQSGIGNNAEHMRVFRESFTAGTFGNQIVNGNVAAGSEFSLSYSLPIGDPQGYDYEIVGIIWKKEGEKYLPVNTWSTSQINTATAVKETTVSQRLTAVPSVTGSGTQIRLELAEQQPVASIDLVNVQGKQVANLHRGLLTQGLHTFEIDRSLIENSGIYFIRFDNGRHVVSTKVIFY